MPADFFLKGLAIGFAIAAPVGPIGVLCIRRSAEGGPRLGLATGAGAAVADAAYGAVAAFGLTAVSSFLVGGRFWLQLLGGFFLMYLVSQQARAGAAIRSRSHRRHSSRSLRVDLPPDPCKPRDHSLVRRNFLGFRPRKRTRVFLGRRDGRRSFHRLARLVADPQPIRRLLPRAPFLRLDPRDQPGLGVRPFSLRDRGCARCPEGVSYPAR